MISRNLDTHVWTGELAEVKPSDRYYEGEKVYLNDSYYCDFNTSVIEVPKYGWQLKTLAAGVATIEYQRSHLNLSMSLMLETKYLTKEL